MSLENLQKAAGSKRWIWNTIGSLVVLVLIYGLSGIVSRAHDKVPGTTVGDLILNALPVVNVDILITILLLGSGALMLFGTVYYYPQRLPFLFKVVALFVVIRIFFISLTYLGAPAGYITDGTYDPIFGNYYFVQDLFFSGHVGIVFLGFLFHTKKWIKYILLPSSMIIGFFMLLMHSHYSIDVFASFFMTYAIYKMGRRFFSLEIS